MVLLSEYALTPGIFNARSYSTEEVAAIRLNSLKDVLLYQGLVRNLRNGEWLETVQHDDFCLHFAGKELLKKIIKQNRLHNFPAVLANMPKTDNDWCGEALASHSKDAEKPLDGIITTLDVSENYRNNQMVSAIDKLGSASFWDPQNTSVRLNRNLCDYTRHLRLILERSNSIMFIDPHLDPTRTQYQNFIKIIELICNRKYMPLIEIHRVWYFGSGRTTQIIANEEWENRFKSSLSPICNKAGLKIKVLIWDDFHDRYLISDLMGISLLNGFDESRRTEVKTTWSRLSRNDRDDIQREFDTANHQHKLRGSFLLP